MKFWQKIYFFSIVVFVLIFNAASIMVIERSHAKMLRQQINSAISQNMSIHSSINAIVPTLRIFDEIDYEKSVLTRIAKEFVDKNSEQHTYLDIRDEAGRVIFNNIDFEMPSSRNELDRLNGNEIHSVLRDIGKRTLLFTTNLTDINRKGYLFTYMVDVTPVYMERVEQYRFFMKIDVVACFFYMFIMFFVSRGLTRSIVQLSRTTEMIAQGGFSERVHLKSKDEIGALANHFNRMAAVVEDKITDLERINEQKQRFINNLTHELKTPLTSIIAYANFLRTTKYKEELFLDGVTVIYTEGKRLELLSHKLMDLIRLQKQQFEMEMTDLQAVIADMKPALDIMAKDKKLTFLMDCAEGKLQMDQDLIKVLIFNLADNAIKASEIQQSVVISSFWRDEHYILQVVDQGIGIAKEHLDKLFEPFYMADKARTRSSSGAGLGLSICQSVADIHGATMHISSHEGKGTTVEVEFAPYQSRKEL